jgi:hypothetical protein
MVKTRMPFIAPPPMPMPLPRNRMACLSAAKTQIFSGWVVCSWSAEYRALLLWRFLEGIRSPGD